MCYKVFFHRQLILECHLYRHQMNQQKQVYQFGCKTKSDHGIMQQCSDLELFDRVNHRLLVRHSFLL